MPLPHSFTTLHSAIDFSAASIMLWAVMASSKVERGGCPLGQALDEEMADLVGDGPRIRGVGLGVDEPRLDLDVVAIAVAREPAVPMTLTITVHWVGGVVVGREAAQKWARAPFSISICTMAMSSSVIFCVVQRRLHRAVVFGLPTR